MDEQEIWELLYGEDHDEHGMYDEEMDKLWYDQD